MKNIDSLVKRVNKIAPKIELKHLVVILDEKNNRYYDQDGKEFTIPKKEDGHIYLVLTDYKNYEV